MLCSFLVVSVTDYIMVRTDVETEETERTRVAGDTLTAVSRELLPARAYEFTVQPRYKNAAGPHSAAVGYVVPKELIDIDKSIL